MVRMYAFRPSVASIRRTTLIVEKSYIEIGLRSLHVVPSMKAAARSPRVIAKSRALNAGSNVVSMKTYDTQQCLPPMALLNIAKKSGALSITPEKALGFLRTYHERTAAPGAGWEQQLCSDHGISSSTLALLAAIVGNCEGKGQKLFGKTLMHAASAMGDRSAIFSIVSAALRHGKLDNTEIKASLQRVALLAENANDPQAMTLLGQVLYAQGGEKEALKWLRKATCSTTGTLNFDGAGEALVTEGRILLSWKDNEGAIKAFKRAALELDDPLAYFYLSQLEVPGSKAQEVYLLKAAISGVVEACHNLGLLELAKTKQESKRPTSIEDYGMANEWFEVAAVDGFGMSMLNLASMCNAVGDRKKGLKWLKKAEQVESVSGQARSMKSQWSEKNQMTN
ncbi:NOL1/NOP2/sun family protein [Diplocarpon rosae]|nr:NOL1/NOP2/sun family protein [Diplocarpon rosae]